MADTKTTPDLITVEALHRSLESRPDADILRRAAALRIIVQKALPRPGYVADPRWAQAIVPTALGQAALSSSGVHASEAFSALALFIVLTGEDLLVDLQATDLDLVRDIICEEIRSNRLLIPTLLGRELYDRFNEMFPRMRLDHLPPEETFILLEGMEQGVYHVGGYVTGPLGLVETAEHRFFAPRQELPLWHCSDIGCRATHGVRLTEPPSELLDLVSELSEACSDSGQRTVWRRALIRLVDHSGRDKRFSYSDVALLIGDCFHGEELHALLVAAMSGNEKKKIRKIVIDTLGAAATRGSAEEVVGKLSDRQKLQLLFCVGNSDLVQIIDACLARRAITIPPSEVRTSRFQVARFSCEVSSLGVRFAGEDPLLDLVAVICRAYEASGRVSELQWHLRHQGSALSPKDALLSYLLEVEPGKVVSDLVLSNRDAARFVTSAVGCGFDDQVDSGLADRILWKLGFDIPRYTSVLPNLRRRLENFNQELLGVVSLEDERSRERVRSAGVNLFVSIEEFLQDLVRFNVWLLASDHLAQTDFRYEPMQAMVSVAATLGQSVESGGVRLFWSTTGENTLGTLLAYLNHAASWIKSLVSKEREPLLRPEQQLPHYVEDDYRLFPFLHTSLWADCDYSSLKRHSDSYDTIRQKVMRSNLAAIRNGLDHQRSEDSFPSVDSMLAFVAIFREVVDMSDVNLFFPKEFWLKGCSADRFRREVATYVDYCGREISLSGPTPSYDLPLRKSPESAVIVAPSGLIGATNADLTFTPYKKSPYSDYWTNYPPKLWDAGAELARIAKKVGESAQDNASGEMGL